MIESQVRGEAMKLAVEWRAKMGAMPENSLEVLGFLQLLAAFKLASAFSAIELQSLLDTIKQHGGDPKLRQGLGITDNLAGSMSPLMTISPDISACLKEEALGLALLWEAKMRSETKNSMEVLGFLLFLAIYGLGPHFQRDQIFGLTDIVLQHRQAAEICQALGLVAVPAGCMQILPVSTCTGQPRLHGRIHPRSSLMQGNQKRPRLSSFGRPHQSMP